MKRIDEITGTLPRPRRSYSPEEIAAARARLAAQRSTVCRIDCPTCGGQGWLRNGDGTIRLCPGADRFLVSKSAWGITRREYDTLNWHDMLMVNGIDRAISAVQEALRIGSGWVYLHGGYGLGKTLILKLAVVSAMRGGHDAAYTRMAEILDNLRGGFDTTTRGDGETDRLAWWSRLPVLAIDEFDRVRSSDYAEERRFVLLDRRYESAIAGQTITILASNSDPDTLLGYLRDRVMDGRFTVVKLAGQSVRPAMVG